MLQMEFKLSRITKKKVDDKTRCKYYPIELPAKETQFIKSKMILTDLCMTSSALTIMSLNGQMNPY